MPNGAPPTWWQSYVVNGVDRGSIVPWLDMDLQARRELFENLKSSVGYLVYEDGFDKVLLWNLPEDFEEPWLKEASKILLLGELEASILDDPGPSFRELARLIKFTRDFLAETQPRLDFSAVKPGSKEHYFLEVENALQGLKQARKFAMNEIVRSCASDNQPVTLNAREELEWFIESSAEIAIQASVLCSNLSILLRKPLEQDALFGTKMLKHLNEARQAARGLRLETKKILEVMKRRLEQQHRSGKKRNDSDAARHAYENNYGKTCNANRQLIHRYKSEFSDIFD